MTHFIAEFLGTLILILLGDGVVANVVLKKSKGENAGWMVITTGWAFAVAVPVYIFAATSGAHFNPAVTVGLAVAGLFPWGEVPIYLSAQFLGAFVGAVLVWITYRLQYEETNDKDAILGSFATIPAKRDNISNLITEIIGTFILVFAIMGAQASEITAGLTPFVVGIIVWAIGLSLGGPTGYAINPARDLGPRIAHAVLPIKNKGGSQFDYAWIPVVGPIIGGILGALAYAVLFV